MCYNFIVTPYNHASTSVAGFSATNSSAVLYTLSYVYNMKVSPYDSSSMLIDFSNSDLSYVSIQAKYGNSTVAGNTIWSSPLSKPLIYNGLIADMCYNFIVTPYNHANIPIAGFTMMNTPAIYTFSYVNNVTLFTNDSSSILIDFSNSDLSYVMIQAKYGNATVVGNTIWSKPLTKPLLYKELIPDMCYNFFVTPYNHANISDVKTTVSNTSPALYTFSYVNNVTLSTNDSSSIFINFSNSDLSYVIIQANYGNTTVVGNTIWSKPLTKPLLYKGLIPDMCYNFIVTPYNHASTSVAGFSATNSSAALYTLSYVYNMKVSTYDSSSMLIDFSNSDLSYVSIQAKYGNSTVAGNTIWNSPLAKPLLYTGLIADMCYNFIVTPYNHANIPIAGFTIMNTPAIYTLSYVNNVTLSTNDSSSILIDFSNSDLSYVMIQANYGNSTVVGNTSWSKPLTKPLLYTGLIPDMCYNFFVTPYNHANISVAGLTATNSSTALYTFSYVYNMKVSPYDSSSMLIDFSNSDLSYVSIQAKYGNAVAAGNTIWSSPLSKPLIYNGLIADMCYNFIVTPYNHATTSIAGFTIMNTPAIYTLSYVNNVTLTVNDSSSILIDFGNSDLSYVSIQANVGNTTTLYGIANLYSKPFTKPIVFQGLQSDVSYTFNVIPYNNANVGGTPSGNIIALYTWAYVNNVTLRANDSSSILIDFSNSDLSYVSIQANVGNTTTLYGIANLYSKPFTKPIVFQGLQADMSYTFNVTPYNNANINGKTIGNNITVYTFSKVTNIMVYPYDSSSLLIDFSNTDLSYITCQAYKGNTTTPYGIANIYSTPFTPPILFKGLQTDVSYSFIVTPYNHDNKAGTYVGNNNAIYTLSTVSNISYSPYDTNDSYSMNINFDNSDLSYVSIQANIGNTSIPYGYPKIFSNPLLKPILYTGLEPDVSYSFIVTPYNHGSIPGFTKGNTTAVCTLSFLSTIMLRIKNSSSVEITFDKNSNLSYIDITTIIVINNNTYFLKSNIFNNPFSSITISPPVYNLLNIIIDGLNFGSTYYFIATPYNHDNIPGTSLISANITF
jgi:hypothetical protein